MVMPATTRASLTQPQPLLLLIKRGRRPSMKQLVKLFAALILMLTLTNCSETLAGSETNKAILDAWGENQPTAVRSDADETKRSVIINRKLYREICKQFDHCVEGSV